MKKKPTPEKPEMIVEKSDASLVGKRILFCIKRDDIQNSIPENAFEADVLEEVGGYASINADMNDGRTIHEWKAIPYLRVLKILGPAKTKEPAPSLPRSIVYRTDVPSGDKRTLVVDCNVPVLTMEMDWYEKNKREVDALLVQLGQKLKGSRDKEDPVDLYDDLKVAGFPLPETVEMMRHELTAVRHAVGTWTEDQEPELYPGSLLHRVQTIEDHLQLASKAQADLLEQVRILMKLAKSKGWIT